MRTTLPVKYPRFQRLKVSDEGVAPDESFEDHWSITDLESIAWAPTESEIRTYFHGMHQWIEGYSRVEKGADLNAPLKSIQPHDSPFDTAVCDCFRALLIARNGVEHHPGKCELGSEILHIEYQDRSGRFNLLRATTENFRFALDFAAYCASGVHYNRHYRDMFSKRFRSLFWNAIERLTYQGECLKGSNVKAQQPTQVQETDQTNVKGTVETPHEPAGQVGFELRRFFIDHPSEAYLLDYREELHSLGRLYDTDIVHRIENKTLIQPISDFKGFAGMNIVEEAPIFRLADPTTLDHR